MTIRITPIFALRRQDDNTLAVWLGDVAAVLNASQARDAAEAFTVMAVMLEAAGDGSDRDEPEDAA